LRRYKPKDIPVKQELLDEVPIHGQLNIEQIVFRLMELTNHSASQDESIFASYIRLLMSYLPSHKRDTILERSDEFMEIAKTLQYKYNCGVPLGTPEHPINGSPAVIEEEVTDWYKLLEIIIETYEECGLTWKFDKWTIEVGKVEEDEESAPPPTPIFESKFGTKEQTTKAQQLKKKTKYFAHTCAICGNPILKGQGKIYKPKGLTYGKRVHKKGCLNIAKTKWIDSIPD